MTKKLIVGLGNPEEKYKLTRHNIGFISLDILVGELFTNKRSLKDLLNFNKRASWSLDKKINALSFTEHNTLFIKPLSYMNSSGESVKKAVDYYNITLENIMVIHDDIDQKTGSFKLIEKGGSGGHKGIVSIKTHLRTEEFKRLKIGVAPKFYDPAKHKAKDFVLKNFSKQELKVIKDLVDNDIRDLLKKKDFTAK